MQAKPADHILDIGSGLGGPARYFANRFGCRVTGIDLTPEFCDVARHLTRLLEMEERVKFEVGDALRMPFADSSFDGAYSMNVSMNIAEKRRLLPRGSPRPKAGRLARALGTPEETRRGLLAAGFDVIRLHSSVEETRAFGARSRAMVERGEKPPHRAVMLIHGTLATQMSANTSRGVSEGRIIPVEVLARRRA
jgi:SAM-dependent methyltransferase